jgi:hypothetical protein
MTGPKRRMTAAIAIAAVVGALLPGLLVVAGLVLPFVPGAAVMAFSDGNSGGWPWLILFKFGFMKAGVVWALYGAAAGATFGWIAASLEREAEAPLDSSFRKGA